MAYGTLPKSQLLETEFLNGSVYRHFDVPQRLLEALISADSKGGFLNGNIEGVYR